MTEIEKNLWLEDFIAELDQIGLKLSRCGLGITQYHYSPRSIREAKKKQTHHIS